MGKRLSDNSNRTSATNTALDFGASSSSALIPSKYRQHRKSSIPFADRSPLVRFTKTADELPPSERGQHEPNMEPQHKSILKRGEQQAYIRNPSPESSSTAEYQNQSSSQSFIPGDINGTGFQNAPCAEKIIQLFLSCERETRGSIDILSFPVVPVMHTLPLSRLYCGFAVTIICIEDLVILTARSNSGLFKEYSKSTAKQIQKLMDEVNRFRNQAFILREKANLRYKEWEKLLKLRGDKSPTPSTGSGSLPIYARKEMPESVSVYEAEEQVMQEAQQKQYGKISVYRSEAEVNVTVELKDTPDIINRLTDQLTEEEILCLSDCLLAHSQDMVRVATHRLTKAIDMLSHPAFDEELVLLKEKIKTTINDAGFDPVLAYELKGTLFDIAYNKNKLINTVNNVVKLGDDVIKFINLLVRYLGMADTYKKSVIAKCNLFCRKRVNTSALFRELNNMEQTDFIITFPATEKFVTEFCHLKVKGGSQTSIGVILSSPASAGEGPLLPLPSTKSLKSMKGDSADSVAKSLME